MHSKGAKIQVGVGGHGYGDHRYQDDCQGTGWMMNQISDNLIFTMQTSEDFPDNKLTTLDTTVSVENNTIQYAFNEK